MAAYRVLVVDDSELVRDALSNILRFLGCEVTEADSGAVALALVPQVHPDLVCLDLWMEGMPGLEVLDRFTREYPGIPVVIVTADPFSDTMQQARSRGAVGYVSKPFTVEQLRTALSAALRAKRATGQ
jgi:CheY-like chemotaxis protein